MKFRNREFHLGRARRLFIPLSEFTFAAFVVPMRFQRPATNDRAFANGVRGNERKMQTGTMLSP